MHGANPNELIFWRFFGNFLGGSLEKIGGGGGVASGRVGSRNRHNDFHGSPRKSYLEKGSIVFENRLDDRLGKIEKIGGEDCFLKVFWKVFGKFEGMGF